MKGCVSILVLCLFAVAVQNVYAQFASLGLECPVPLGCPCNNPQPLPDGTPACLISDVNDNGPDSDDPAMVCWALNSEYWGMEPGTFILDYHILLNSTDLQHPFYVDVQGSICCWRSDPFRINPGAAVELTLTNWTCSEGGCIDHRPTYRFDNINSVLLTEHCNGGDPLPAGTDVSFFCDLNANGPDSSDPLAWSGPAVDIGGHFIFDHVYFLCTTGTTVPCYAEISGPDVCWNSITNWVPAWGTVTYSTTDWTCGDAPCNRPSVSPRPRPELPTSAELTGIAPNPFNAVTRLTFELPGAGLTRLEIFDVSGRHVRTLLHETLPAGSHTLVWNGRDDSGQMAGSGIYFCALRGGGQQSVRRVLLLR